MMVDDERDDGGAVPRGAASARGTGPRADELHSAHGQLRGTPDDRLRAAAPQTSPPPPRSRASSRLAAPEGAAATPGALIPSQPGRRRRRHRRATDASARARHRSRRHRVRAARGDPVRRLVPSTRAEPGNRRPAAGSGRVAAGGVSAVRRHDRVPADSRCCCPATPGCRRSGSTSRRHTSATPSSSAARCELISAEDDFANMLAHMLALDGHAGAADPTWREVADGGVGDRADVLMVGPGPGDPRATDSARIKVLRRLTADRLASRRPLVAVCLGHQVLASELRPGTAAEAHGRAGRAGRIDLCGTPQVVGFYNTFTAVLPADPGSLPLRVRHRRRRRSWRCAGRATPGCSSTPSRCSPPTAARSWPTRS